MVLAMPKASAPPSADPTRFGARHALTLTALLLAVQLVPIVGLIGGNAQSEVAIHFHTTKIAWFNLTGALVGTFVMPFAVKAANIYGKKRMMVALTICGLVGDLIAAVATNYSTLLIGRGVAGLYSPLGPLAYSMARDVFPRKLVGPASGLLGGGVGLVALGGPFLSGWLIDSHGFRGALWFMVIATVVVLGLILAFIPESSVRERESRMDWLGGLLLGGGLTMVVYAIGQGSEWGWTSTTTLAWAGAGVVAVVAFGFVEGRVAHPLFPKALLSRRRVWTVLLATSVAAGAVYAVGTMMQLLALMPAIPGVSDGLGWSATRNATVTAPMSALLLVVAVATGALARRTDTRILLAVGGIFTAGGYGLASQLHHSAGDILVVGLIAGVGMGIVVAVVPIMVIQSVSSEEQALGNGAQNIAQGVVQVIATQVVFVIMARDGKVMHGTQFYLDSGFTHGFWLIAAICAVGVPLALLIPKIPRSEKVDSAADIG
ncbi:hypothetical protein GCM10023205_61950 [Yinghuangia aomiensis]|uniref:Major facilitator superfamily (MFS) profile domain-containing protein n=1 Tax=Yinghuangia aomiensis TaxID=676205 RepID=A0ABP9I103_9ACTN